MFIKLRFLLLPFFLFGCGGESNLSDEEIQTNYSGIYSSLYSTTVNSNGQRPSLGITLISEENKIAGKGFGELTDSEGNIETSLSFYPLVIANVFRTKYKNIDLSLKKTDYGFWGDWSIEDTEGKVSLTKSEILGKPITPELIAKNWALRIASSNGDVFTLSINLDSEGLITGSDTNGCVYLGNMKQEDFSKRIPSFKINVSSCGELSGNFEGLMAIISTSSPQGDELFLFSSNELHSFNPILNPTD